ncbi:translation initiation factor IF-2 [Patescibacteria group bacterium]|nr:translation initiation factor IF-2 [Patescibacteria group bacterium]
MTQQNQNKLIARPPVVVVLGHVDHGKSSILQAIKNFKILEKESGGITQHIGAYEIEHQDRKITFIDTPGHEAFSQIRSRGAKVADIAVLVVAAEEGVKPQTKEAISIIKKAEIPFIVAINKIDKPEADPEKVKRELSKEDILVESMGGEVPLVEVSAKTGKGISDLLEIVLLVADMEGLEADISKPARGVIIEAYLDNLRGPTATLLLSEGRLEPGQIIGTFSAFGKIKILEDFQGNSIPEALPSQPVIVLGLEEVPRVGEEFKFFSNLEEARTNLQALKKEAQEVPLSVDSKESEKRVLNIIIIADVLGSLEAIEQVLGNIPQEKVALRILKAQVGEITESDVKAAKRARAKILGFRVKANSVAKSLADRENIKIMQFEVIYELVEGVRNYMERMVKSEMTREDLGKMKILAIFRTEKNRQILGGRIIEGEIRKGTQIEVMRGEEIIGKGKLINLQRNKKDAEKILKGDECGILYEGSVKAEEGDVLLIYTEGRIKGEL